MLPVSTTDISERSMRISRLIRFMVLLAVQASQFHAIFVLGNEITAPVPIKEAWCPGPPQPRSSESLVLSIGWTLARAPSVGTDVQSLCDFGWSGSAHVLRAVRPIKSVG